jgi:uncharacterized protein (TIGR02118 family)
MVKVIVLFRRKPGMDLAEFADYWANQHADFVRRVPGISRYVQSQTLAGGYRSGTPVFDGMAEIWYDRVSDMQLAAASAAARDALEDDRHFLDMSSMITLLTDEVLQKECSVNPSMVKLAEFPHRRNDLEPGDFHRYWTEVHGPLAAKIPQIRRYVQSHVRPSAYRGGRQPLYDGVAQVWFDSTDAMRASALTPEYKAVREDEPNFIAQQPLDVIITRERIII